MLASRIAASRSRIREQAPRIHAFSKGTEWRKKDEEKEQEEEEEEEEEEEKDDEDEEASR